MNKIAKAYSTGNKTCKINKEKIVIFRIKYSETMKAFQKHCLYEK